MNPDDKTYTVELSAWEISQLVHCHTRTIKKISNAAGKAVTQERVKLLPSSKEMGLIIDAAQNHQPMKNRANSCTGKVRLREFTPSAKP